MTIQFDLDVLDALDRTEEIAIQIGDHHPTTIWVVVIAGQPYVQAWRISTSSWSDALRAHPQATIHLDGRRIPVTAQAVEDSPTLDAIYAAIAAKYTHSWPSHVPPFREDPSRATAMRLLPR